MPNIFSTIISGELTITDYLICTAVAIFCGVIVALSAFIKNRPSKSLVITIIMLPPIVETVLLMVNGSVGTGIAVAGAFSLIRFRSTPAKAKELVNIFLSMTSGIVCASGFIGIAVLFTLSVSLLGLVLTLIPLREDREKDLFITIPESLNYAGEFDDIFSEFTSSNRLISVKTVSMGSLYKLLYRVELKHGASSREFIDMLRTRNGNLEISICDTCERTGEL